jgi:hypothetical protein
MSHAQNTIKTHKKTKLLFFNQTNRARQCFDAAIIISMVELQLPKLMAHLFTPKQTWIKAAPGVTAGFSAS